MFSSLKSTNSEAKRKFDNPTTKTIAHWLGEAWGDEVKTCNVRLRGNWVFVRDPYFDDEVDALFMPHGGDLHGEPWTGVRMSESPFVVKNKKAIKKLTGALDAEYKAYLIGSCNYTESDWQELLKGAS